MPVLNHYTTPANFSAIQSSGVIRATGVAGDDASHGSGVYLTPLMPQLCRSKIAGNNWGDGRGNERAILAMGKVDRVVQVTIPSDDPALRHVESGARDIYLYKGDIHLKDYPHSGISIKVDGSTTSLKRHRPSDTIYIGSPTGFIKKMVVDSSGVTITK